VLELGDAYHISLLDLDRRNYMETNPKSTRAGKQLPEKKEKVYSTKYHAVKAREWRENNPEACTASGCRLPRLEGKSLCEHHRDGNYINMQKSRDARKLKVLTHYGKDGTLQCFWEGCTVCDPDMLSLDHKNDDGSIARKSGYDGCGDGLYRAVI
jgi:hypothetical protein